MQAVFYTHLDVYKRQVNNHIGSDETHVTAGDKQNWNGKADVAMLETERCV